MEDEMDTQLGSNSKVLLGGIAIGRNAQSNTPREFVLNVELHEDQGVYTTFRTILSDEEFTVMSRILRRMVSV
jgi:hypothetical protein